MAKKSAAAMMAAVLADVDNDDALMVYVDWLQEQGDPRGELAVAHQVADKSTESYGGRVKARAKAEKPILAKHGKVLLGAKLANLYDDGLRYVVWRSGFIDRVSISFAKKTKTSPYEVLSAVLASPSAVLLRKLELAHVPAAQHAAVVKTLLASKARPPLRDLHLREGLPEEVLEAFPSLRGRRDGDLIEKVVASDGPISNVAPERYKTLDAWSAACTTRVISNRFTRADCALPIFEPRTDARFFDEVRGLPNRAAIAHATKCVIAGELEVPYTEPRQRSAANHLIWCIEAIGDPVPKALRDVALGATRKKPAKRRSR